MSYLGLFFGSLVTILVQNHLTERNKERDKVNEDKRKIYIEISGILQTLLVDENEKEASIQINKLLGEAYIIAPDQIILGIKHISEDKIGNDKIKGENITKLILSLRKEIVKDSKKLKPEDHFTMDYPENTN